jgi:hypothetical protein
MLYCPSAVGEPLNVPEELKLTPGGKPVADQVYGGVPPEATKLVPAVWYKALPIVIFNRLLSQSITLTPWREFIVKLCQANRELESVTSIFRVRGLLFEKLTGVPLMTPVVLFKVNPLGKVPCSIAHESPLPPDAWSVVE